MIENKMTGIKTLKIRMKLMATQVDGTWLTTVTFEFENINHSHDNTTPEFETKAEIRKEIEYNPRTIAQI